MGAYTFPASGDTISSSEVLREGRRRCVRVGEQWGGRRGGGVLGGGEAGGEESGLLGGIVEKTGDTTAVKGDAPAAGGALKDGAGVGGHEGHLRWG